MKPISGQDAHTQLMGSEFEEYTIKRTKNSSQKWFDVQNNLLVLLTFILGHSELEEYKINGLNSSQKWSAVQKDLVELLTFILRQSNKAHIQAKDMGKGGGGDTKGTLTYGTRPNL